MISDVIIKEQLQHRHSRPGVTIFRLTWLKGNAQHFSCSSLVQLNNRKLWLKQMSCHGAPLLQETRYRKWRNYSSTSQSRARITRTPRYLELKSDFPEKQYKQIPAISNCFVSNNERSRLPISVAMISHDDLLQLFQ